MQPGKVLKESLEPEEPTKGKKGKGKGKGKGKRGKGKAKSYILLNDQML